MLLEPFSPGGTLLSVFSLTRPLVATLSLITLTASVEALYIPVETALVPVERLVANLEREAKTNPDSAAAQINLARLHGMAYALKTDEVPAGGSRPGDQGNPWYGHEPNLIPYQVKPASTKETAERAAEHLAKALEHYRAALRLDPHSLLARLGYAWVLDQAGRKQEAIAEYRRVIATAWPKEERRTSANLGERFFTEEAAGYLIPLLDPVKDAAEIATLRERHVQLRARPRPITPVAVPLSDELPAHRIHDRAARIRFDADGSGLPRRWSWITREAGWLVYDAEGTGQITSALQLFGNVTFWLFWLNGYEALASLDDNRDGELAGAELKYLAVWHDRNENGRSDPGEVRALDTYGIIAISCDYDRGDGEDFAAVSRRGVRFSNGTTRPTYDVILRVRNPTT